MKALLAVLLFPVLALGQARCKSCEEAALARNLDCLNPPCVQLNEIQNLCPVIQACLGGTATTTTLVGPTTTTLPPGAGTLPSNVVTRDPDGATRWLKWCDDLPSWRSRDVAKNQMLCGRNGDIYYSDFACRTGAQRPLGMPWQFGPPYQGFSVPGGSIIYPNRWGIDAPGWNYRATSITGGQSCTLGAKPPVWCKVNGCVVESGTCRLTAQPYTIPTFLDGNCTFKTSGADIGAGGGWGPTAGYEEGKGFPLVGHQVSWGDNNMRYAYQGGRMEYGGVDETTFAAGAWGHDTAGAAGTYVAAGSPGFGVYASPTLGVATAPPLVLVPIVGNEPTTYWGCYGLGWQNTLGGRTRMGPQTLTCAPFSLGGLRISMPERQGWVWPRPFPVGGVIGVVWRGLFPGPPCQPLPGQTTCQPILPKEVFLQFFDYLYNPADFLDQKGQGMPERGGGPSDVNASGFPINPVTVSEHSIGIGPPCTAGAPGYTPGVNCFLTPSNGWWYMVVGDKCVEPFGPGKGAHCDDSPHSVTLPNPLPAVWRTDQMPFCAGGVCFRRNIPLGTGTIFRSNGYSGDCTWRYQEAREGLGGLWEMRDVVGICGGQLRFFGPGGLTDVKFRCDAAGCRP